jgi:hypothetical protein
LPPARPAADRARRQPALARQRGGGDAARGGRLQQRLQIGPVTPGGEAGMFEQALGMNPQYRSDDGVAYLSLQINKEKGEAMRRWNGWGDDTIEVALGEPALRFLAGRSAGHGAPRRRGLRGAVRALPPGRLPPHPLVDARPPSA